MKKYAALFKRSFQEFMSHKAARLGAALAYYTIFSIAPLLLIAIAIAGMVFGKEAARGEILLQLKGVLGVAAASAIDEMVRSAARPKAGSIATIIGVITLIFGASGVFAQLQDALNTIWDVEPKESGGLVQLIKDRFLSVSMVFGVGFLLLVSLVIDAAIAAVGKQASHLLPGGEALWQTLQLAVSLGVVFVLFALIFRYLPDSKIEWRDVWLGAGFTAVLFVAGKFGLSVYLGKAAIGSSFGAAGSLIVLLVWIYWSAQILFFGAEVTHVYAQDHGSLASAPAKVAQTPMLEVALPSGQSLSSRAPRNGAALKIAGGAAAGVFVGAAAGAAATLLVVFKVLRKTLTSGL